MYKTDKIKLIKKMEDLDLKTLIKTSVSYDEPKKKLFIEVLKEILHYESFYDSDESCHECGHYEVSEQSIVCNYLASAIKQIKSNSFNKEIFTETKNKIEVV